MARPRAVVRQWTLLRVLSQNAEGLSIEDMARQASVNPRTIRRDLRQFVEAGIPLRETVCARNKKIWRIDRSVARALANHSTEECLALLMADHLLRPLHGTRFFEAFALCRDRVLSTMSHSLRRDIQDRLRHQSRGTLGGAVVPHTAQDIDALWETLVADRSVTLPWATPTFNGQPSGMPEASQAP